MRPHAEIAGAGIGGLTAGLALASRGWSVRVHEQDGILRIPGAGIFIFENGLRVLETLGVVDRVIEGVIIARRLEMREYDGTVFSRGAFTAQGRLYVPLRRALLVALHDALLEKGGEIVFNSRAVTADPDGRLDFENGTSTKADLVVAADGLNSSIRDSLGLLKWRKPAGQHGFRCMIRRTPDELVTDQGKVLTENWNGSRRLLYAPCTAEETYVQLTSITGDVEGNAVPVKHDYWHRVFPKLGWIIDRVPADGHSDWFSVIRLKAWHKGRVVILGDAANAQPPFLGQGGGCAMMAALSLAHEIDMRGDIDQGIAAWEAREKPFIERVQMTAYFYGQMAFAPPIVRRNFFRTLSKLHWLRRRTTLVAALRDPPGAMASPLTAG
jgi:2-polyprenyl-6-methoxyphenol hydroxylase-like FAD-dependent oxidoreductase